MEYPAEMKSRERMVCLHTFEKGCVIYIPGGQIGPVEASEMGTSVWLDATAHMEVVQVRETPEEVFAEIDRANRVSYEQKAMIQRWQGEQAMAPVREVVERLARGEKEDWS